MPSKQQRHHQEDPSLTLLWILLGVFGIVFVMIPLLYFGRHAIWNDLPQQLLTFLDQVVMAKDTLLSSQSFLVALTTFLVIVLVHSGSSLFAFMGGTSKTKPSSGVSRILQQKDHDDQGTNEEEHHDDDDDDQTIMIHSVNMYAEDTLDEYPFVLTKSQRMGLLQNVLPRLLVGYKWKRLYSVARDGDSFSTLVQNLAGQRRTLVVVQTTFKVIVGAYCDVEWKASGPTAFQCGSATKLFRLHDDDKTDNKNDNDDNNNNAVSVDVYPWTGKNEYVVLVDRPKQRIAFGGGSSAAAFALCIDSNFTKGSTAACPTFGNPSLCEPSSSFDILDMEVYGFCVV